MNIRFQSFSTIHRFFLKEDLFLSTTTMQNKIVMVTCIIISALTALIIAARYLKSKFTISDKLVKKQDQSKNFIAETVFNDKGYDEDYDLGYAIERVHKLSEALFKKKEKLCLFIGRTPGETFPGFGQDKPDVETWVSLDTLKSFYGMKSFHSVKGGPFIPGKQLHLQLNMNDNESLKKIYGLFDKVVVDFSTLKFHSGKDQTWYSLGKLLRPQEGSQLITETSNFSLYPVSEIIKLMPIADRDLPLYKLINLESYEEAKQKWTDNRDNRIFAKLKSEGCFSNVVLEAKSPYPYMYQHHVYPHISPICPYFILSGPQPKLFQETEC